ncbi:serine/threonine-protein kinase [uncultured Gimesia sp.]|uniref:serine/threonine-protein kinase n=1 Tax=uncultured Gimesia sp. TaxID=1678688 RepID=UPI002605817A|nr:serine/threonine-protein kinase [uncultured Gimesia sp.]
MSNKDNMLAERLIAADDARHRGESDWHLSSLEGLSPENHAKLTQLIDTVQLVDELAKLDLPREASQSEDETQTATFPPVGRENGLPDHFGDYRIRSLIARGGFGAVFLAEDQRTRRKVAIKVPRPDVLITDDLRYRFLTEARAAGTLCHPNIVTVREAISEPTPAIVYEYCEGGTLADVLRAGTELSEQQVLGFAICLAEALKHAHDRGVLHRDLKPSNILLTETSEKGPQKQFQIGQTLWTPKLTDFGLARLMDDCDRHTRTGTVLGTTEYMAPEQVAGQTSQTGTHTDIFAFGILLYQLLTGKLPFQGPTRLQTLLRIESAEPDRPRLIRPQLSVEIELICLKCLQKVPEARYESAAALLHDLKALRDSKPISIVPPSFRNQFGYWYRQNRRLVNGLVFLNVFLIVVVLIAVRLQALNHDIRLTQQEADLSQQLSRVAQYFRSLSDAKALVLARTPESQTQALDTVEAAARENFAWQQNQIRDGSPRPTSDTELRTATIACLQEAELRPAGQIAPGFNASVVAFHPQGHIIAIGEDRYELPDPHIKVNLYEFPSGDLLAELSCPGNIQRLISHQQIDGIRDLEWSPDGRWLAASRNRGQLFVWDTQINNKRQELDTLSFYRSRLLFSPDSRTLYANTVVAEDNDILLKFELAENDMFRETASTEVNHMHGMACSKPFDRLYALGDSGLHTFEPRSLTERQVRPVTWSFFKDTRDGSIRFIIDRGRVGIAAIGSEQPERFLNIPHGLRPSQILNQNFSCSSNGNVCLIQSVSPPRLHIFDTATGTLIGEWLSVRARDSDWPSEVHPTGRFCAVPDGDRVQLVEISRFPEHRLTTVRPEPLECGAISPLGTHIVTATQNRYGDRSLRVQLTELNGDDEEQLVAEYSPKLHSRNHRRACVAAFHPHGDRFAVAVNQFSSLSLHDIHGKTEWDIQVETPRATAFSPTGDDLWVAHASGVQRLELKDGKIDQRWRWSNLWPKINNGGRTLTVTVEDHGAAVSDSDGRLHLFSVERPPEASTFRPEWSVQVAPHLVPLTATAFNKTQGFILAGDEAGFVYKVDTATRAITPAPLHSQKITSLGFINDSMFFTSSYDGTVGVWKWNEETPEEIFQFPSGRAVLDGTAYKVDETDFIKYRREGQGAMHVWNLTQLANRFSDMAIAADGMSASSEKIVAKNR